MRGDVDADLVEQGDRAHRPAPGGHRLVDEVDRRALHQHVAGLAHERAEDAARVKAVAIVDDDDRLALLLADGHRRRHHLGRRLLGLDDLEQRHLVDGAEVVHPDHVLGVLRRRGDLADGDRRGVGGDDHPLLALGLDLAHHGVLDGEVLEDGLDHEVDALHARVVDRGGEQGELLVALDPRELLLLHVLVEDVGHVLHPARDRGVVAILEANGEAGVVDRHVGDAAAHEAGAEHGDLLDLARLDGGIVDAGVLLHGRGGEEDLDEPVGDARDDELAEGLGLGLLRGGEALVGPDLEDLEDALGRGVVAAGLLLQLLLGLLEEHAPAQRVLLQGDARERLLQAHAPARRAEGEGRALLGELEREGRGDLDEDRRGDDVVDDAERFRLGGAEVLAGEAVVERDLEADLLGEALQPVEAGEQAELHLGEREDRLLVVAGDATMAGERDLEAAAERRAVDRGDHRLGRVDDLEHGAVAGAHHRLGLGRRPQRLQHLDVGAGDPGVSLA